MAGEVASPGEVKTQSAMEGGTITVRHYVVLRAIVKADGGTVLTGEVRHLLADGGYPVTLATVNSTLRAMEAKGWLKRKLQSSKEMAATERHLPSNVWSATKAGKEVYARTVKLLGAGKSKSV